MAGSRSHARCDRAACAITAVLRQRGGVRTHSELAPHNTRGDADTGIPNVRSMARNSRERGRSTLAARIRVPDRGRLGETTWLDLALVAYRGTTLQGFPGARV